MKKIDLRSDTVTLPTDEMRKAMYQAEVGDDVYGEDPTINRLEEMAAEITDQEAALFTTSGTQGNLVAVLTHTCLGDEVILGDESHILWYEVGGAAALGGVVLRTVPNLPDGRLDLSNVEQAIRGQNLHYPVTTLICLENTHNRCGGPALTPEYTRQLCDLAHSRDIKVHLDGARIFNAAVAFGVFASELTRDVDSVSFCLSKALSAPVGSLLCGSREFIDRARRKRKMLGGGMRQAGILAAAGIVALETMVERLAEDHANARKLAEGLAAIDGVETDCDSVQTNIVMFALSPGLSPEEFARLIGDEGIKVSPRGGSLFRAVTHRMITAEDIDYTLQKIRSVCAQLR